MLDLDRGQNHLTCLADALDECLEDDVRATLKSLGSLSDTAPNDDSHLQICFCSLQYLHITFERCQHLILDRQDGQARRAGKMGTSKTYQCSRCLLWAEVVVQILNQDSDRGNV